MIVPIPCKFGEKAVCKGRELVFYGVAWYKWLTTGMQYTYFFETGDEWSPSSFYESGGAGFAESIEVDDSLVSSFDLKSDGIPFRGTGYVEGIDFISGKRYASILSETFQFSHHRVECDEKGHYIPGGDIIFQRNWKPVQIDRILLKRMLKNKKVGE